MEVAEVLTVAVSASIIFSSRAMAGSDMAAAEDAVEWVGDDGGNGAEVEEDRRTTDTKLSRASVPRDGGP
jgi:hypothetical protein